MTLRAVTYSRYSSDQQNPRSAADQTRLCRVHAEAQGWRVVDSYEDLAVSGASRFRPEFQRLLANAKAHKFDVVVCEALDRLGRKLADIAELFDQADRAGAERGGRARPARRGLGAERDQRRPRQGYRGAEQRALHRPPGLGPAGLDQGPEHRAARGPQGGG